MSTVRNVDGELQLSTEILKHVFVGGRKCGKIGLTTSSPNKKSKNTQGSTDDRDDVSTFRESHLAYNLRLTKKHTHIRHKHTTKVNHPKKTTVDDRC